MAVAVGDRHCFVPHLRFLRTPPSPSPSPSEPSPPADPTIASSSLWLTFGDQQGSATAADAADSVRNAYTPYGAARGVDELPTDHGWLNQGGWRGNR